MIRLLSAGIALIALPGFYPFCLAGLREMNAVNESSADRRTAIIGCQLIDGNGGEPLNDATLIVRGSKIIEIGPTGRIYISNTDKVVEASGLTVIPGLVDTHFHSKNDLVRPITYELENGVTSFRDPGHPWKYYDNVLESDLALPRIFLTGGHLDGEPAVWPDQAMVPKSRLDASQAVHSHVNRGASGIKVYFRLPIDYIEAVCQAADERGVPVTAHLELVRALEAIEAGVDGIEHITSFGTELASEEDAAYFEKQVHAYSNARRQLRPWLWSKIDVEGSPRLTPLLHLLVREGVFVSPTIAIFEARIGENEATQEQVDGFESMMRFLGKCHEAGVRLAVGSHTRAPFADEGHAYLREMELLIEVGMTPLEAITAATKTGAEFLGIDDRLGTIEPGKLADLVLAEGDPTENIRVLRDPVGVMLNGVWVAGSVEQ